jgi:hypothetical protein
MRDITANSLQVDKKIQSTWLRRPEEQQPCTPELTLQEGRQPRGKMDS